MRMAPVALTAILALAVVQGRSGLAAFPAREQGAHEVDRGSIAVLRRDGLMIPFASFRGTRWMTQWPAGLRGLELPVNLRSIPERWWGGWTPEGWQVWPPGGTARPVTPIAPQIYRVHCDERIGLRTDYRPAEAPPLLPIAPYPKDGLVATAGVRVEPISSVGPTDADWGGLAVALLADFNRAEDREMSVISTVFSHPLGRDERRLQPVRVESWYRTRLEDGSTVSYIEAVRSYPPGPEDDGCGLQTLFSGWVTHEKDERRPRADLQARVTYCDRVGATFMQPLGRIRLRDRVYWIAQVAGNESEWYIVVDVAPGQVRYVVEYPAGSRNSCR